MYLFHNSADKINFSKINTIISSSASIDNPYLFLIRDNSEFLTSFRSISNKSISFNSATQSGHERSSFFTLITISSPAILAIFCVNNSLPIYVRRESNCIPLPTNSFSQIKQSLVVSKKKRSYSRVVFLKETYNRL